MADIDDPTLPEPSPRLHVARPSDVAFLHEAFRAAQGGTPRTVVLTSSAGGGKRAMVGEFLRELKERESEAVIWRASLSEEEDGTQAMLRLYAGLYASLHADPGIKGKVELALNTALPSQPKRTQGWIQAFTEGLRKPGPKPGQDSFEVSLPRDNPMLGLVAVVKLIGERMPVVLEVQAVQASQSVGLFALLEALIAGLPGTRTLIILGCETLDQSTRAWLPAPLVDLLDRRKGELELRAVEPWSTEDVAAYLQSKGSPLDAAALTRLTGGLPGYVAELADALAEADRLDEDLAEATLASLWPREVDEDELDEPTEPASGGRRHAKAADLPEVAYRAALLGRAFPSTILADIAGLDRDSVDDLLDACTGLFSELQYSEPLQTWVYQFTRGVWRQGVIEAWRDQPERAEEAATIGRATASFMERALVPRSLTFVPRTARLYAELGDAGRASALRALALSGDQPQVWAMAHDLMNANPQVGWPGPMRRAVFTNLLDRLVQSGDVSQAEALFNDAMAWATEREDRAMQAWILFAGSRLDFRRQDLYRARDRARDALTLYKALGDNARQADLHNHLATVELQDGNTAATLEQVEEALKLGQIPTEQGPRLLPQVAAQAEFIRGQVQRRERKFTEASEHFRKANEIAGQTNQAGLALESGLAYGEALLAAGQGARAADVLQRVFQIAQALQNGNRGRAAAALLAQAHGSQRSFEAARRWAATTLDISKQLKLDALLPVDTYNVGFFTLAAGNANEALALFRQARATANLQDAAFAKELLFNLGVAALRVGEQNEATQAFNAALPAAQKLNDHRKVMGSYEALGDVALARGDKANAQRMYQGAIVAADAGGFKEERKALRRKLESAR